jgi:hypothetical protein
MPHQDQSPKLGPPVDLGVSAGPCALERTPTTTSIASFDAPTIPNEPTNTVTKPVSLSTQYIEPVEKPGTLNVDEPSTLYEPSKSVHESSIRNVKEPVTTPVVTSTPVGNPDDSLVIPRHLDPRVKLGYLGINEKPEEAKPPVVYGKIDGRVAQIMLDTGCSTYVLSTDFARAGNVPCFPCKPIPVELAVRNASQFTQSTQTKKLPMEIGSITSQRPHTCCFYPAATQFSECHF